MFERLPLGPLGVLFALNLACEAPKPPTPAAPKPGAQLVLRGGPAYFVEPRSGILELGATERASIRLPLARHRPGRSELKLDGFSWSDDHPAWALSRQALELRLDGGLVAGLHRLSLFTPQYSKYPLSPPVLISVAPATPAELTVESGPAKSGVQRIFYPGYASLSGAQLAWLLESETDSDQVIEILDSPRQLRLPAAPKLQQATWLALRLDHDPPQLLAVFPSPEPELWLWSFDQDPPRLQKISPPKSASKLQAIDRISVGPSGFLISLWEGRGREPRAMRPGDLQLWRLQEQEEKLSLNRIEAQQLGQLAQPTDLRLAGLLKLRDSTGFRTHLQLTSEAWLPQSGPVPGQAVPAYFWRADLRPPLPQRCAIQSSLGSLIWAGVDSRARLHAGLRPSTLGAYRALELPKSPDPALPESFLALLPLPLDCALVQGRFVAIKPNSEPPFSQFLHFDGRKMQQQSSELRCQDAAFTQSEDQSLLWCLHNGSLSPITLGWQKRQEPKAAPQKAAPASSL